MNVWFLTDEFPPNFGGGIGMYVDIVSRMLSCEHCAVTVITADLANSEEKVTPWLTHVRFRRPTEQESTAIGSGYITLLKRYCSLTLDRIARVGAPDIIELPEYNAIGYYLLQYKRLGEPLLQNVKLVVHCQTPRFEISKVNQNASYQFPQYWIGRMERFCLRAADALLTQSEFLKRHLICETGGKPITVIPLPYFFPSDAGAYTGGEHLLYVGRLEYRKGVWQFLQQMERHWREGCATPLVLLGGDTLYTPTQQMLGDMIRTRYAHRIRDGRLRLMDKVPPEELQRLMQQAKAVVVPSLYENFAYTNVIAMSSRVPVLVSKQGGHAETVAESGVNGYIFDWDIPDDCYRMIGEVLAQAPEELRRVGEAGYRRVYSLCAPETNQPRRMAFYEGVLREPSRAEPYPFANQMERTPLPAEAENTPIERGLLSVIIPYYNLGETVEETVQSLLASDYPQMEIILVDDGSTDASSIAKADELAARLPRLQLVRISNGGLANARNIGKTIAKGEFLCYVDADDRVKPTYFSRCIRLLQKYENVSFVYSWVEMFGAHSSCWLTFDTELPYYCTHNQLTAMAVVRRLDYLAFGENHVDMCFGLEDYDGWMSLIENGRLGVCIPEMLVDYRIREYSMARSMGDNIQYLMREMLAERHKALYDRYGAEIYCLLMQNGSNIRWSAPVLPASGSAEAEALRRRLDVITHTRGYRLIERFRKVRQAIRQRLGRRK